MTSPATDPTSNQRASSISMACPTCREVLNTDAATAYCASCGISYACQDQIWRLLRSGREQFFARWVKEYEHIRRKEGRDFHDDPAEYLTLPFVPAKNRHAFEWAVRAATYRLLVKRLLDHRPLRILDLGAGNCWLSYRLASAGHVPVAADLRVNDFDGLGAARHYRAALDTMFLRCQIELDALPFPSGTFDIVLFNSSFHYSTDYTITLAEALRVLTGGGSVVIADSPVYHDADSGPQMLRETHERFQRLYGFRSDSVPSVGHLTYEGMHSLGRQLGVTWKHAVPWYGWRWFLKPWLARLTGRREPAQFGVWIGQVV